MNNSELLNKVFSDNISVTNNFRETLSENIIKVSELILSRLSDGNKIMSCGHRTSRIVVAAAAALQLFEVVDIDVPLVDAKSWCFERDVGGVASDLRGNHTAALTDFELHLHFLLYFQQNY